MRSGFCHSYLDSDVNWLANQFKKVGTLVENVGTECNDLKIQDFKC